MNCRGSYDVLIIGAGPAGSSAAKVAAERGSRVLLLDRKVRLGMPVQCAEFVPLQLMHQVEMSSKHIACQVSTLKTYLPDGEIKEMYSPGFMLQRALFDKDLAVAACEAGAELLVGIQVKGFTPEGILVEKGGHKFEIKGKVIIGADGPKSLVGSRMGSTNSRFLQASQYEVVWPEYSSETLAVYFDPAWETGYGWVFPKGRTVNIGIGCLARPGGFLAGFLSRLGLSQAQIVGRTGGLIPVGGPLNCTWQDRFLLCGDAAGFTHPITGAGILAAVISGKLAGKWAALAVEKDDLNVLQSYEYEWRELLFPMLNRGLENRRYLWQQWTADTEDFCRLIRETWIAYPQYGRKKRKEDEHG